MSLGAYAPAAKVWMPAAAMTLQGDVKVEVELPVIYETVRIDLGYRIDLLVNDLVVVELKVHAQRFGIGRSIGIDVIRCGPVCDTGAESRVAGEQGRESRQAANSNVRRGDRAIPEP